jgi:hypothetical protein
VARQPGEQAAQGTVDPGQLFEHDTQRLDGVVDILAVVAQDTRAGRGQQVDVRAVGNWLLDRAEEQGESLTAMKLQKLAYVSHGWHLAVFDEPLTHDPVEANAVDDRVALELAIIGAIWLKYREKANPFLVAGVFIVARLYPVFAQSIVVMTIVAVIGTITLLVAGLIASIRASSVLERPGERRNA